MEIKTIDKLPRPILIEIAKKWYGFREPEKVSKAHLANFISSSIATVEREVK